MAIIILDVVAGYRVCSTKVYGDEARLKVEHRCRYVIMMYIGHSYSDCEVLGVMVCSRTAGGLLHGYMRGYQQLQDACMAECAEGFAL